MIAVKGTPSGTAIEIFARRMCCYGHSIQITIAAKDLYYKKVYIAKTIEFEEANIGDAISHTFDIDSTHAQVLMDELWNCGIRPTEGAGTAGSMRATQEHLTDLRKIISKKLGIQLGGLK